MRVPCIVRWPGHIDAGRTSDELARVDGPATRRSPPLCGAELPTDRTIDGVDIAALLLDGAARRPRDAFFYYWMNDLEAVRVGRWKLHLAKYGRRVRRALRPRRRPRRVDRPCHRAPDVVAGSAAIADDGPPIARRRPARRHRHRRPPIGRVADAAPAHRPTTPPTRTTRPSTTCPTELDGRPGSRCRRRRERGHDGRFRTDGGRGPRPASVRTRR